MAGKSALDTFTQNLTSDLLGLQNRIVELCKEVLDPLELEAAMLRGQLHDAGLQKERGVFGSPGQATIRNSNVSVTSAIRKSVTIAEPEDVTRSFTIADPEDVTLESNNEHVAAALDAPLGRWECMVLSLLHPHLGRDRRSAASFLSTFSMQSFTDESMIDEYWGMHSTWSLRPNKEDPQATPKKMTVLPASMRKHRFATMTTMLLGFDEKPEHHGDVLREEAFLPMLQSFTLNPDGFQRWSWAILGVVVLALDLVTVPMQAVGIGHSLPQSVNIATYVYWVLDLPCELLTGVHRDGLIDMRPSTTMSKYAKTWMLPDLALLILDFLILFMGVEKSYERAGESLRAFRIVRILRVIRAHKLRDVQKMIETCIFSTHLILSLQLFWLILCMLTFNHWVACAWFGISSKSQELDTWIQSYTIEHDDTVHSYLAALHWSLCQFSPATTSIAPENSLERGCAICIAIFGLVVFSSFVSNVTNAVNQLKVLSMNKFRERTRMQEFLRRMKVSTDLGRRIQMFFNTNFNKCSRPVQEQDLPVFLELPESLRIRLHLEIFFPALRQTVICTLCDHESRELLTRICHTGMNEAYYCAAQDVFVDGFECQAMYYVKSGVLQYHPVSLRQQLLALETRSMSQVYPGEWLSEAVLWLRWVHAGRLEALAPCTCVVLSGSGVRNAVSKARGSLFKSMRMYAILFVSYFEEMDACNYGLSDLPIPTRDSEMLVDRALRLKEGFSQGLLKNFSEPRASGFDHFWNRWAANIHQSVRTPPVLRKGVERLKSRMSRRTSSKHRSSTTSSESQDEVCPEGGAISSITSTVYSEGAHLESDTKIRDCKFASVMGRLSL